jgi:hypothetical protein
MTWVAVGVAGASLVSGALGAGAAESAASQQAYQEQLALAQQRSMFNTIQGNEQPFIQGGQAAQGELNNLLGVGTPGVGGTAATSGGAGAFGSLNTPFNMDTFKSLSPQYGFNLQQGGQGTLNVDSSGQGAESGAALKDLMSFNQNYANNSFNSAFGNYQTQQNNIFNRLNSIATLGSNAGSNSATGASSFAGAIGNTYGAIGAANASGTIGAANAITGGLQSGANAFYGQNALNQILNSGSTVKYGTPGSTSGFGSFGNYDFGGQNPYGDNSGAGPG